jgi:hypothetical protein
MMNLEKTKTFIKAVENGEFDEAIEMIYDVKIPSHYLVVKLLVAAGIEDEKLANSLVHAINFAGKEEVKAETRKQVENLLHWVEAK